MKPLAITSLVLFTSLGPALAAQDGLDTSPAKELQKFARFAGAWEGTGTVTMAPGGPKMDWTMRSSARWVLDGHFLRDDSLIDLGPAAPADLSFCSFYGFNKETGKYMLLSVGNMGGCEAKELVWVDADTLLYVDTGVEEGRFYTDRWIHRLGKDSWTLECRRSFGADKEFTHLEGTFKRAKKTMRANALATEASMVPAPAPMVKLARSAGDYRFKGSMNMPGAGMIDISAREKVRSIYGGSALTFEVTGDAPAGAPAYRGFTAMSFDPTNERFTMIYANNMGECGVVHPYWLDDTTLVTVFAGKRYGQPRAERSLMKFGKDGSILSMESHAAIGNQAPIKAFSGTMIRQKKTP